MSEKEAENLLYGHFRSKGILSRREWQIRSTINKDGISVEYDTLYRIQTENLSGALVSYWCIVYSVDRFSRSGANAIYITEQLKRVGITVQSVTQPTDATTASGSLQQNIQFIFSEYDNQLRREKCMAGVRDALLRGEWVSNPPIGYSTIKENSKRKIVVNQTGKLLRKAFLWKANEKISNEERLL